MSSYLTANMNLVIPVPGSETGPDWASDLNSSLTIVDSHDHSSGSGVQITPSGININADLTFNQTANAIALRSTRFTAQASPLALSTDKGCLYVSGVDLYYNDVSGNQVRMTQAGSVSGSAGTITGLPSGTASASFSAISGTFTFIQATSTAANMDVGSIAIRYPGSYPTPSGNYIQIQAPSSLASGYSLTLPALPAANNTFLTVSTAGAIGSSVTVDDSTLQIGSHLQVKDSGISTIKINDGAVTPAKLAALGQQISSSSGSFSTASSSYVDVTNLSISITTTGRPVFISLIPDGSGAGSVVEVQKTGGSLDISTGRIAILRDGSVIATYSLAGYGNTSGNAGGFTPPGGYNFIDIVVAGTYAYKVQAEIISSNTSVSVLRCELIAYEL